MSRAVLHHRLSAGVAQLIVRPIMEHNMPSARTPIAIATERTGISVVDLAAAIGINVSSCWDLLNIEVPRHFQWNEGVELVQPVSA